MLETHAAGVLCFDDATEILEIVNPHANALANGDAQTFVHFTVGNQGNRSMGDALALTSVLEGQLVLSSG